MKKTSAYIIIAVAVFFGFMAGMLYQGRLDSDQFEQQQKLIDSYEQSQKENQRKFEVLCGRQDKLPPICQNLDGSERLPVQYE